MTEWTITTWNIHGRARPRVRDLAAVLRRESPDVIALQEVRWWQARRLGAALRMRVVWRRKHYPFTRFCFPLAEGAAILTRPRRRAHGVEVISEETQTTTYRRRIAQWVDVEASDGLALRVFNVHLSPEDLSGDRLEEADRLRGLAASLVPSLPTVIAGDLNDHGEPDVIERLPAVEFMTPPPTNPSGAPDQVLDHVLLPPDSRQNSVSVPAGGPEWAELSDHLPVTVRFTP